MAAKTVKRRRVVKKGKTRSRSGSRSSMNITSPSQFGKLKSLMGKSPVILVFVYADWCGHCQHFKPDWKKLEADSARNMPMVSIRDDVFSESPLSDMVTVDGYPSVAVVSPANNISMNLQTREPTKLKKLVQNANMLTPPSGSNMTEKVNTILEEKEVTANNSSATATAAMTESKPKSSSDRIRLVDVTNEVGISTHKPPTHVKPVTRDTVEPPLSEEEFAASDEKTDVAPQARNYQLGGVWSSLSAYNRRRSN